MLVAVILRYIQFMLSNTFMSNMLRGVKANCCGWVLPPKGNKFGTECMGGFCIKKKKKLVGKHFGVALQKLMGSNITLCQGGVS